ncbi:MAG: helix-turn-helix transcriptional regulator [Patescibacteria group bacterium]
METISWNEHKKEMLKDAKLRKELEKIEPEFELARQIIGLRIKNKMSQTELAEKAHTRQPVISRIESGNANPRLQTIEKIGKALGKKVSLKLT